MSQLDNTITQIDQLNEDQRAELDFFENHQLPSYVPDDEAQMNALLDDLYEEVSWIWGIAPMPELAIELRQAMFVANRKIHLLRDKLREFFPHQDEAVGGRGRRHRKRRNTKRRKTRKSRKTRKTRKTRRHRRR